MKILFFVMAFLAIQPSFGQVKTVQNSSIYKSSVDSDLTIKNITIAPLTDNISDIYAAPLNEELDKLVSAESVWNYNPNKTIKLNDFSNTEEVRKILASTQNDALIAGRISKSRSGINIKLVLYVGPQGLPLGEENLSNYDGFETTDLKSQLSALYQKLKTHIPYHGMVLGRKDNLVTINIGSNEGVQENQIVDVVQILKITRHPKFNFLINTEKEILGRIRIQKVESKLSFGAIEYERFNNLIAANMKLDLVSFISHQPVGLTKEGQIVDQLAEKDGSEISLGKNPTEYVPAPTPTFGQADFMLGLGSYNLSNSLSDGTSAAGTNNLMPSAKFGLDLWITQNWFAELNLKEYIFTISNSLSSPGNLNANATYLNLAFGYSFLLTDNFFGPKFQLFGGYTDYKFSVDGSSPTAFTSMDYSGLMLGVGGSFPLSDVSPYTVGAKLSYYLSGSTSESPVTSGSSSNSKIANFSFWGDYRYTNNIKLKGSIDYDLYYTSFSGQGSRAVSANSISHNIASLYLGIGYLF